MVHRTGLFLYQHHHRRHWPRILIALSEKKNHNKLVGLYVLIFNDHARTTEATPKRIIRLREMSY